MLATSEQLHLPTHKNEKCWRQQLKLKFAASTSFCLTAPFFFLIVGHTGFGRRLQKWSFLYLKERQREKHREPGSVSKSTRYVASASVEAHPVGTTVTQQLRRYKERQIVHSMYDAPQCTSETNQKRTKQSSNHESSHELFFSPPSTKVKSMRQYYMVFF